MDVAAHIERMEKQMDAMRSQLDRVLTEVANLQIAIARQEERLGLVCKTANHHTQELGELRDETLGLRTAAKVRFYMWGMIISLTGVAATWIALLGKVLGYF